MYRLTPAGQRLEAWLNSPGGNPYNEGLVEQRYSDNTAIDWEADVKDEDALPSEQPLSDEFSSEGW